MKHKILDLFCLGSSNFKIYDYNNVILDYARSYIFEPKEIPDRERACRFQGLSTAKFNKVMATRRSIEQNSIVHEMNDVLYVPTHKNFYHMIIDCLPRLYCSKIDSRPVVMCKTYLDDLPTIFPEVQKWFPKTEFIFINEQPNLNKNVSSHSLPGRLKGNNIGFYSNDDIILDNAWNNNKILPVPFWQEWYKDNYEQQNTSSKVFIYRKAGDSVERLANQEEICHTLKKYDFQIVDPIEYSFKDMAKLMNSASIIIGAHGAGLANAIFCKPNTKYIQLANSSGSDKIFEKLARYTFANYKVIFGLDPTTGLPQTDNRYGMYAVDVKSIIKEIV